ncbi:MAG: 30S ribosomal protein S5 [Candidatus Altiarchaeales archaeon]|nr:30S ribosomal protein S5 [Candidatus Altiarchaeales archaeon]
MTEEIKKKEEHNQIKKAQVEEKPRGEEKKDNGKPAPDTEKNKPSEGKPEKPETQESPDKSRQADKNPKQGVSEPKDESEDKKTGSEGKKPEPKGKDKKDEGSREKTLKSRGRVDRRRPRRSRSEQRREDHLESWIPKTRLGQLVASDQINSMHEALKYRHPIKEVEIVDKLLPELTEKVLDLGRVQRTTDSGRRMRFRVVAAVGNQNGFVGIGVAKGKDAGPTIRKAIKKAKLNIIEVKRGCGSWECVCKQKHSIPYAVHGKVGSVDVVLKPAPRGTGLVCGELSKQIISLAGIQDVWASTEGHTRSAINFAKAVNNSLYNTNEMRLPEGYRSNESEAEVSEADV